MPSDRKWEEMVARHFVDQASLVLEATLSGNVQKIGEPSGSVSTAHYNCASASAFSSQALICPNPLLPISSPFLLSIHLPLSALPPVAELQRTSIPGFFASLQEDGACDMYFSYQGCQIDINSPISSVNCTKATLVISYTKPVAFKVCHVGGKSVRMHTMLGIASRYLLLMQCSKTLGMLPRCASPWHALR